VISFLPTLLAVTFALDVAGTLDVSDTARVYAREASIGADAAVDIENTPRLELVLDRPTTSLAFEYAPHLYWSDVIGTEPSPTLLLHTGGVRLSSRQERLNVSIVQTFAVGDQSFARVSTERYYYTPRGIILHRLTIFACQGGVRAERGAWIIEAGTWAVTAKIRCFTSEARMNMKSSRYALSLWPPESTRDP